MLQGTPPTTYSRVFPERAEMLLGADAELRRELQLLATLESGTLIVACGPCAAEATVGPALARLMAAHPRLRVECIVTAPEQALAEVLERRADVGVSTEQVIERKNELHVERYSAQRLHPACRPDHPLTRERALTLERALQYPLVTVRMRGDDALQVMPGFTREAFPRGVLPALVPPIVVNSLALARQIARGCDALVPGLAARLSDDVAVAQLTVLDLEDVTLRVTHAAYHRRDRPLAPAAQAFLGALRDVQQALQVGEARPA